VFCPIEKLELKVNTCPACGCIYKGVGGACHFTTLTKENVGVKDIAAARQKKPYMVQTMASTAKHSVTLGATLLSYAQYIKDSFPGRQNSSQTVNKQDDTQLSKALYVIFGLSQEQQKYFWDESRVIEWSKRKNITLTISDIRALLLAASIS
jgi:hypothetical protein